MAGYYERLRLDAAARLRARLDLPTVPAGGAPYEDGACFNPWDMFPALYGTYSADFDEMAIAVLLDVRDGTHKRADLAAQMFREMLCTGGFCEYGTSPRVCFPAQEFMPHLGRLIERWREYRDATWLKQKT